MVWSRGQGFNPFWQQLQQFQNEVNRLFDRWGEVGRGAAEYPPVNIFEDGEALWVEAELPGLSLEDLEIYVTAPDQLTLKGQRRAQVPEKGVRHRQERPTGAFARTLTLPFPVDPDRVEARLEHGVLRLRLLKHESARPRKIVVKG